LLVSNLFFTMGNASRSGGAGAAVIDVVAGIDKIIASFNDQNVDRGTATQAIVEHLYEAYPDKNVMVVHSPHLETFNGSVHRHMELPQTVGTIGFEIYVFDDGDFTLLGDGGFQNWCFKGNYERDGKSRKVKFLKR